MRREWLQILVITALVLACICGLANAANKSAPKAAAKPLPRLVDIGSDYCLPCQMMEPILQELAKEYQGRLKVEAINATKQPQAAAKYKAKSYPTQIFFNAAGKELYRHEGFLAKSTILAKFRSLGIKLTK